MVSAAKLCWRLRSLVGRLRPGLLYLASVLFNLALTCWLFSLKTPGNLGAFVDVNVAVWALPAVAWLLLELRWFRPARERIRNARAALLAPLFVPQFVPEGEPAKIVAPERIAARQFVPPVLSTRFAPAHRVVARVALAVFAIRIAISIALCALHGNSDPGPWTEWLALAATTAAVTACLWDGLARDAVAKLYLVGLVAAGVLLDQIHPEPKWLWWTGNMILAAYAVATSYLWSQRASMRVLAMRLRIPSGADLTSPVRRWLVPVNCALVIAIIVLSFGFVFEYSEIELRIAAAQAIFAQMVTLGLLARGERSSELRYGTLLLGVLGAIASGWARLAPTEDGNILNRAVVAAAAMSIMAILYGLGLIKFLPDEKSLALRRQTNIGLARTGDLGDDRARNELRSVSRRSWRPGQHGSGGDCHGRGDARRPLRR